MMRNQQQRTILYMAAFMFVVALLRVVNATDLGRWSNFTPIGAMALFGGVFGGRSWRGFGFPLVTLLLSDIVIDVFVFHGKYGVLYGGFYWVYAGISAMVLIGTLVAKRTGATSILLAAVSGTLLYWLIVDFSVWLGGGVDISTGLPLTRNFAGLLQCYWQGLPFIKNFLLGTLVYSALFFGADFLFTRRVVPVG
jgi:hypothetical protein